MKPLYLTFYFLFFMYGTTFCQNNMGIGTASPNQQSLLELYSKDKGLLIPRMATAERLVISPLGIGEEGLLVYDTDEHLFYYWDGTRWVALSLLSGSGANISLTFDSTNNTLTITDGAGGLSTVLNLDVKDEDHDTTNELQNLGLVGDTLSISGGNQVVLPSQNGIPFMSQPQINGTSPYPGMLVYNTTTNSMNLFDGETWRIIGGYPILSENVTDGGQPCPGTPTITVMGETYNTVLIGNQCWMAENLNIGTYRSYHSGNLNDGVLDRFCYDNVFALCDTLGGLYHWNEIMNYNTSSNQGVCPNGWHIPSAADYNTLIYNLGGEYAAVRALSPYGGSGFDMVYGGYSNGSGFIFGYGEQHLMSKMWIAEYDSSSNIFQPLNLVTPISYSNSYISTFYTLIDLGNNQPPNAYSCRCIKD